MSPIAYNRILRQIVCLVILCCLAVLESSEAATLTWTGGAGTSSIYDAANWSPAQVPVSGDTLTFAGSTGLTPSLGSNLTVGSITFNTTAGTFTINGGATFTINSGGITNSSTATKTFNTLITMGAAQTWAANAGAMIFNGNIANGGFLLTLGGVGSNTINGILGGSGGLSETGTGILALSGANTYTGDTTLSGGIVQIGNNSAFGTGVVNFNSRTLKVEAIGGSHTIANLINLGKNTIFQGANDLTMSGNVSLPGNRTITTNGTGITSFTGNISGSGNRKITKAGTGTLYLSGNNTFTGGYMANTGTTIVGSNTAFGSGTLGLGTSTFQAGASSVTLTNVLSLTGDTTFAGTQNLIFSGNGALTANRIQTFNGSGTVAYNGVLSGGFAYNKKGTGTVIFGGSSANTYSGATYLYDGQLTLAKSSVNAFAGTLRIGDNVGSANSAIVQLNASNQVPDASALSIYADGRLNLQSFSETVGATSLYGGSIIGTGTLGLNGNLSFSGTGGAQAVIDTNLSLNLDRIFTIDDNGNSGIGLTINGAVSNGSGTRALTKTGLGTLLLTGANTFSGVVSDNAGTILLGSSTVGAITSGPLGTGAVNLGDITGTSAASLLFNSTSGLTVSNAITARTGSTGTLTLGGLNISGIDTFSGALVLNRTIAVTAEAAGEVDINGAISGVGGLTKIGAGIVKLNSANTFSGTMTLSTGTLAVGVNNALGSGDLTLSGGTLDFGTSHTDSVGNVTLTSGFITGTGTLTSTGNFALSSGSIYVGLAGTGSLAKSTADTVTLSGSSTYTGATSVTSGTLELARSNALASTTAVSITAGANLSLLGNNNQIGSLSGAGNVALGSGTLTTGDSTSTTFSGIISGSGGLTKTGSGVFTLSAVNTYTGATTINNGTLRLGIANAINSASAMSITLAGSSVFDLNNFDVVLGSIAGTGNITQGTGALTVGADGTSTTLSGVISGTGNLTKNSTGTLTLTATDTLSGVVDVTAGKIKLAGASGSLASISSVIIRSGATVELDNSTTENNNRLGNSTGITLRGGALTFSSDSNGTNESVGALTVASGSSTVQVNHNGSALDSTSLTFSSLGTVTNGATVNFVATGGILGSSSSGPHIFIIGQTSGTLLGWATVGADAAEYYLFGVQAFSQYYQGASGININDTTKLVRLSSTSPSSAYTLSNTGLTTNLGLNLTDLTTVDLGASTGNSLNLLSGSLIKSTATATTISGNGTLTAGGTSAANLNVSVTAGSALTIASLITDNAGPAAVGLVKGDSGTLTLSGINTFTGNVFINDGLLNINSEVNLGAVGNDVTFNGGTLHLDTGFTTNSAKIFTVNNGLTGTLDITTSQTLTLANTAGVLVTGNTASTLIKTGAGSLVIANANTAFDGALKISAGTVEIQNAQSLGDATNRGTIQLDGGTLALKNNSATAFNNSLSVTADSTINVDRLSGSGAVAHTLGNLDIGARTLTISGANSASLTIGSINLSGAATFQTTTADLTTGAIGGNFGLTKSGAASLTVAAASTYTGATNLNAGTLRLGASNVLPDATALTLASGTTFDLANFSETVDSLSGSGSTTLGSGTLSTGSSNSTYSGNLSGTGGLTKIGVGTTTLDGVSSYTGDTNINAGTLALAGTNRLSSSTAVTVAASAILNLLNNNNQIASLAGAGNVILGSGTLTTGTNSSTYSGTISGTGGLTKTGSGTTTINGTNTYSGTTTINGGKIVARSTSALGAASGGVTIAANAELQIENNTLLAAKPLTTSGTLRNNSGNNAYLGSITQAADSTIASDSGSLTITGSVDLAGKNLTVASANGSTTSLSGVVSGNSGSTFTKTDFGSVTISGNNTYSGSTVVSAGTLQIDGTNALGATGSGNGTTVSSGATLLIDQPGSGLGMAAETLTLNGTGVGGNGALRSNSGNNIWAGNIILASDSTIRVDADTLTFSGSLTEAGSAQAFTKSGSGTVILSGTTFNTGATNITAGIVQLDSDERISDNSSVVISSGASLDLNDNYETVGSLSGAGNVQTGPTGGNTFTVGANNTSTSFSGIIQGSGNFEKVGVGNTTISGVQTYTGATTVSGGKLNLTGTASTTTGITITVGGTLTGTGTTNAPVVVETGGTLTAGLSGAGQLSTGNINLNTGSTLLVEVAGTSQYDSINLTGSTTIAGDLSITLINGYTPNYTLLNLYGFNNTGANTNLEKFFVLINDGNDAISGAFSNAVSTAGYFGGAPIVNLGGAQYLITYTANSATGSWIGGNDIAFTVIPEVGTSTALYVGCGLLAAIHLHRRKNKSCVSI